MRSHALLIVMASAALVLAAVITLRNGREQTPAEPLPVDQPSLGVVLPPLDNRDPVTSRPHVTRDELVGALEASRAQAVHLYLYWEEVQPTVRSAKLQPFLRLVATIRAQTHAQVMVTLVQKVPCSASSDPRRRSFAALRNSDGALLRNQYGDPVRPRVNFAAHQELTWNEARHRWDVCNPWLAPTSPSRFGDFAQTAASALADLGVHDYEIGNEPNHDPENDVPAGESAVAKYASLFTAAARGIRRADPQATIVAGAFSGDGHDFLSDLYSRLGARKALFDAVSVHEYPAGPPQKCRGSFWLCGIAKTRAVMEDHGDANKSIWLTELGYSTCAGENRCVSEDDQAKYLRRETHLLLDRGSGMHSYGVSRLFIYDLHDFGWSKKFGCGGWCSGYWSGIGLLKSDLSAKPAFRVFRKVAGRCCSR